MGVAEVGRVGASLAWTRGTLWGGIARQGGPAQDSWGPRRDTPQMCVCLHVCVPRSDTSLHKLMTFVLCLILSVLLPAGTFLTSTAPCGMGTPCAVQPVTFRLQSPHCW